MMNKRMFFSVLLGIAVTPLAGFIGSLVFPLLVIASLWAILVGKGLMVLWAMSLLGAKFIWPVTIVFFPLLSAILSPAGVWVPYAFMVLGGFAGFATAYTFVCLGSSPIPDPKDWQVFVAATVLASTLLGLLYGYWLRRFDQYCARTA